MRLCAYCDSEIIGNNNKYCGRSCRSTHQNILRGGKLREKTICCSGCHKVVERKVRKGNDAGLYCSRECSFNKRKMVARELKAIYRIGVINRAKARRLNKKMATPQYKERIGTCKVCNKEFTIPKQSQGITCSDDCRRKRNKIIKAEYKLKEKYKSNKRAAKSRRKALMRGSDDAKPIDPIKVFERDKWVCHICGTKTIKSKRGTIHPKAPELEHIVSLSEGGGHHWGNVACSHRECNHKKGSSSYGQIGLDIAV